MYYLYDKLTEIKKTTSFLVSYDTEYDVHLFLGYYFKQGDGEKIHDSLRQFKNNVPSVRTKWINLVVSQLDKLKTSKIIPNIDVILRSLSSSETSYTENTPLSALANKISALYEAPIAKNLITKTRRTKKLSFISKKADRFTEIDGVFQIVPDVIDLNNKVLLVIDDIKTSGTTTDYIAQLINANFSPKRLILLSLAQTNAYEQYQIETNGRLATALG